MGKRAQGLFALLQCAVLFYLWSHRLEERGDDLPRGVGTRKKSVASSNGQGTKRRERAPGDGQRVRRGRTGTPEPGSV
ncbi:hypothetical protein GQ53DRAFT_741919 [Thozetella sp. PMI_491]|nr:hypothetical protein GQ53DRAFT_741919 [Thozetella sp. PMI_491]